MDYSTPYQALASLAELSRQRASGLPQQETIEETWTGVGFRIASRMMVTPMHHVTELLTPPSTTRLPGVQPWVLGVANVRGRLVPVIDLCGYLGLSHQGPRQSRRVLIVENGDLLVGLLVDQVQGMQHFSEHDRTECAVDLPESLTGYVESAYEKNNDSWHLFSIEKLISQERFMQVAA